MTDDLLYFAYGSNMAAARLASRVRPVRRICIASLRRHRLAFHKVSDADGSGKCDAAKTGDAADRVLGVVYALSSTSLAALDRFEGCGFGYARRRVIVHRWDGHPLEVETYIATRTDPDRVPFDWYKEHVVRGAVAAGLPAGYIAKIEAATTQRDPDVERRRRELSIYRVHPQVS
jgi:gamma-glutamylcyclotransferase